MNGKNSTPQHLPDSPVLKQIGSAGRIVLFLDYDGTLVPFEDTPEDAKPTKRLLRILQGLAGLEKVSLCIISGRELEDITSMLNLKGVWFVGLHGIEMQSPDHNITVWKGAADVRGQILQVKERVGELLNLEGVFVEDKTYALAIHYRKSPDSAQHVASILKRASSGFRGLELLCGDMVVEVRPGGCNKGFAVKRLLETVFNDSLALYIGDDITDEDAFSILKNDGITVCVFREQRETFAKYYLFEDEVLPFLEKILP